jgi:hypothetical protein
MGCLCNVSNLSYMFYNAKAFNQRVGSWNVANMTDIDGMFNGASAFDQDLGSANVISITGMIRGSTGLPPRHLDLGMWPTCQPCMAC